MTMARPEILSLHAGDLSLDLVPETGGSIARFRMGVVDLMRPSSKDAVAEGLPRSLASFPLIPFSNRIKTGVFAFDGKTYELAKNFGDHPHTIHGNAWQRPWRVEVARPTYVHLVVEHDPARDGPESWPFAYRAAQIFRIEPKQLEVTITIRNQDRRPMPVGIGLHPYFPRTPDVRLTALCNGVWLNSGDMVPLEHVPVPEKWDFGSGRALQGVDVDNCFTGWDGAVRIDWPARHRGMIIDSSETLRNLVVFVPPDRDYFAVEPVSNVNDGFNLMASGVPDTGVTVLRPGETLGGTVRFRIVPPLTA
jgi:aldose 1-epimerase